MIGKVELQVFLGAFASFKLDFIIQYVNIKKGNAVLFITSSTC